ncbi:unnamed protein product [marine sediment metagenome]|uniref:Uncharacterized protein n=1 Tax=marine sediment metagenome TaxID=412755 RepID=X1Q4X6_9ZZZZ
MAKGRKSSRQTIPKEESKADRFVRVVTPRMAKAMKAIRTIGFCAGATYEYTPKQVEQIIIALTAAVVRVDKQFTDKKSDEPEFGFDD